MPTNYTVSQGECISSLAAANGFAPETLWNHAENAQLKASRKDPNVLYSGDSVYIPDKQPKMVSKSTDDQHVFKRKGVPTKIRIRLTDDGRPRANVPYQLEIDGVWVSGRTDGDGYLEHAISPTAQGGTLRVGEGTTRDVHALNFGTVDPVETDTGVTGRLADLGYGGDDSTEALKAFQKRERLTVSGKADDATKNRLKQVFGQ